MECWIFLGSRIIGCSINGNINALATVNGEKTEVLNKISARRVGGC